MNKNKSSLVLFEITLFIIVYVSLAILINGSLLTRSGVPYYNYLIEAFTNKRLNLFSPLNYDLSLFAGRWYMYWGPAPILFVLPFYIWRGAEASDILYTLISGLANIILFYFIIEEFVSFFKINITCSGKFFVWASFALISPNLYLSLAGRIWHTSQVIGIFYLLLCLLSIFKFLNNSKKDYFLIFSIIFYNLAWMSRYTLIFHSFIFMIPVMLLEKDKKIALKKLIVLFCSITIPLLIIVASYNYLRFDNLFETGFRFQIGAARYNDLFRNGRNFSINFIKHNFFYYFLNPIRFSKFFPYITIDREGNSIFLVYPTLIFLLFLFDGKIFKERRINQYLIITGVIVLATLFLLLTSAGTGWTQFGSRYFFDLIPLLLLCILFVIEKISTVLQNIVFFYGFIANLLGTLIFYEIFK